MAIDEVRGRLVFTTNDMLVNQLHRDGPRICRSFDKYTKNSIAECSPIFGRVQGMLLQHLPRLNDDGFKATSARLLTSASNAYVAGIEVARHGYRRQYGIMARALLETLATVIVLAIRPTALEEFHTGNLRSTKCVGWSKDVLPPIGEYYGMLSNEFAHIGKKHAIFEPPTLYKEDDEALPFIINSIRGDTWLLYVVAELVYYDEFPNARYWFDHRNGAVAYNPSPEERAWMARFLEPVESLTVPAKTGPTV